MRKGKLFLVLVGVIAIIIAGGVFYVFTNINAIVKAAIEKYGSQATRTDVNVSSVDIRLSTGQGAISGVTVANPAGFTSRNIFSLGKISTQIAVKSVAKSPLVIDDIRISGPEVFYEMNSSGSSNLDIIKKNLQDSQAAPKKEGGRRKEKGSETRLFIKKLVFESGKIDVRIAALGDKPVTVNLPQFELRDIGGHGGATPAEIAKTVVTALAQETAKVVARTEGERYLRNRGGELLKRYLGN